MENQPANRLRVMVVEDDLITARDLETTLTRRGFPILAMVGNAVEAREALEKGRPDIVLLDIKLSGEEDGVELARYLRQDCNIPVIFITGYSEDAVFDRARELKPAGFVRKPFSDSELVACLESASARCISRERLELRLPGLQAAASQLDQAVVASDVDGVIVFINQSAVLQTGWNANDAIGQSFSEVIRLEEISSDQTDDPESRFAELISRTGLRTRVEERSAPIRSNDGDVIGVVHVFKKDGPETNSGQSFDKDPMPPARATALKKVAALAQDPAFRDLLGKKQGSNVSAFPTTGTDAILQGASPLIEDLGDPLIRISSEGFVTYSNRQAEQCFNGDAKMVGTEFWKFFDEKEFYKYENDFNKPLNDGLRHKFDFHDIDRAIWFEVRLFPSQDGVLGLFQDITDSKIEAAEMVRHQRLEGLGLLARGFAHDFNNHLTSLTGNLSLARDRHTDDDDLQDMLSEAQSAANRAAGLVQQLMTFARGGRPIREPVRVPDLIRRILGDRRDMNPGIRYQFQGSETELRANLDPAQIYRLVENLVTNAELAMLSGGVLIVRCGRITPDEVRQIRGNHVPPEEEHLLIEVIDTGVGISEEELSRVFEPYFTTRKKDNATGIGLTVCESIAKAHDGFVHLQSKEGKGTIATFCTPLGTLSEEEITLVPPPLPAVAEDETAGEKPAVTSTAVGKRILILEDDDPIRRLMSATLKKAGYEVVETCDGRETVAAYQEALEQGHKYDLLISDLTIEKGVGGVETMKHILEIDPRVLAIVSSGYSDAAAMSNPSAFGFSAVLPKPYAPSQLRDLVDQLLMVKAK